MTLSDLAKSALLGLIGAALLAAPAVAQSSRLDRIKGRGTLVCGVPQNVPGFAVLGADGKGAGFDLDICRAVAAALLGSADKARFVATDRFDKDDPDVILHGPSWTLSREAAAGIGVGPITFHDGQAVLIQAAPGITSVKQIAGARVCTEGGTYAANLAAYAKETSVEIQVLSNADWTAAGNAFAMGQCEALSAEASRLFGFAASHAPGPYFILDERLSKAPLAPMVRREDDDLLAVLRWTIYGLIQAEEAGIDSANVDQQASTGLFALPAASSVGLAPDFLHGVIGQVGNYGEIYVRNFGRPGGTRLARGQNDLAPRGGLLYAPPLN
jgi:general L-amino acid transport system substrate-binding protein